MGIFNDIIRIKQAKQNLKISINNKGGNLTDQLISDYYLAVDALTITPPSSDGNLSFITATSNDILQGKISVDVNGNQIEGNIETVTAALNKNVITVPKGYIETAQTLTVNVAQEPAVVGNVVTFYPGYVENEKSITIGNAKEAQTYTPNTADQTIAADTFLTGVQTIKGDANLLAENIKKGISIFGITGTHQGGSESSANYYKCAIIHKTSSSINYEVSGITTPSDANGIYEATELKSGTGGAVYKHSEKNYYYFETNLWGFGTDYSVSDCWSTFLYNADGTWWRDGMDPSGVYCECSVSGPTIIEVSGESEASTWDGYKAVLSNGSYSFEETLTEGLVCSSVTPEVDKIYTDGALVEVRKLYGIESDEDVLLTITVSNETYDVEWSQYSDIASIQLVASASDGGTPLFVATNLPAGISVSTAGLISGTPSEVKEGSFKVYVAYPGAVGKEITINYNTLLQWGSIELYTENLNLEVGKAFSYQYSPYVSNGGEITSYEAEGLPDGLTLSDTGLLSGTPTTDDVSSGSFKLTITAYRCNDFSTNISYTVCAANDNSFETPYNWSDIASGTAVTDFDKTELKSNKKKVYVKVPLSAGVEYTFWCISDGAGGFDEYLWLYDMNNNQLASNDDKDDGSKFTYTTETTGYYMLVLGSYNDGGIGKFSEITVTPAPGLESAVTPEITVTTPVTLTGTQNSAITDLQLTATVSDNGTPIFTSSNLPAGLTLSNTGLISGTPTGSGSGSSTITVSYDGAESKTITLNWTIEAAGSSGGNELQGSYIVIDNMDANYAGTYKEKSIDSNYYIDYDDDANHILKIGGEKPAFVKIDDNGNETGYALVYNITNEDSSYSLCSFTNSSDFSWSENALMNVYANTYKEDPSNLNGNNTDFSIVTYKKYDVAELEVSGIPNIEGTFIFSKSTEYPNGAGVCPIIYKSNTVIGDSYYHLSWEGIASKWFIGSWTGAEEGGWTEAYLGMYLNTSEDPTTGTWFDNSELVNLPDMKVTVSGSSSDETYVYTVSGAGTTAANGDYWESEEKLSNMLGTQITAYTNGSCSLYQDPDNSYWYICNGTSLTDVLYMCDSGVSGTWKYTNGASPAPTVTEYGSTDSGSDDTERTYVYTASGFPIDEVNGNYWEDGVYDTGVSHPITGESITFPKYKNINNYVMHLSDESGSYYSIDLDGESVYSYGNVTGVVGWVNSEDGNQITEARVKPYEASSPEDGGESGGDDTKTAVYRLEGCTGSISTYNGDYYLTELTSTDASGNPSPVYQNENGIYFYAVEKQTGISTYANKWGFSNTLDKQTGLSHYENFELSLGADVTPATGVTLYNAYYDTDDEIATGITFTKLESGSGESGGGTKTAVYRVSGCSISAINGDYYLTEYTTDDGNLNSQYPVYQNKSGAYLCYFEYAGAFAWGFHQTSYSLVLPEIYCSNYVSLGDSTAVWMNTSTGLTDENLTVTKVDKVVVTGSDESLNVYYQMETAPENILAIYDKSPIYTNNDKTCYIVRVGGWVSSWYMVLDVTKDDTTNGEFLSQATDSHGSALPYKDDGKSFTWSDGSTVTKYSD